MKAAVCNRRRSVSVPGRDRRDNRMANSSRGAAPRNAARMRRYRGELEWTPPTLMLAAKR